MTAEKIGILAFSEQADGLRKQLVETWEKKEYTVIGGRYTFLEAKDMMKTWFTELSGIVIIGAAGIAVRLIAEFVSDKEKDPAVLVLDELGKNCIPILSGHLGGANILAQEIADFLGGQAILTTATDIHHVLAIDSFARKNNLVIADKGMIKEISFRFLAGESVGVVSEKEMQAVEELLIKEAEGLIKKDDTSLPAGIYIGNHMGEKPFASTCVLLPKNLIIGIGCKKGKTEAEICTLVESVLSSEKLSIKQIAAIASIDIKMKEPGLKQAAEKYRVPLQTFSAEELQSVKGDFSGSAFVQETVGVDNVCERSACLAAGDMPFIRKQAADGITIAVARKKKRGVLYLVGFGPGEEKYMTGAAKEALEDSEIMAGYTVYIELIQKIYPNKQYYETPMRREEERCRWALERAAEGYHVALVCSGDSGIYGMAALVYELWDNKTEVVVVGGVTAAISGGAVLGAPLAHDFSVISLSDLLTPWELIEKRLESAAAADMVICLYNPSSKKRKDYLQKACDIILQYHHPDTVCGYVKNIGREGENSRVLTLGELKYAEVDMFTTVFIGNSTTKNIFGKMVTPRGYRIEKHT